MFNPLAVGVPCGWTSKKERQPTRGKTRWSIDPWIDIVGVLDKTVQESKNRLHAAIKNAGLFFPDKRFGESSETIRARMGAARQTQRNRSTGTDEARFETESCNIDVRPAELCKCRTLDDDCRSMIKPARSYEIISKTDLVRVVGAACSTMGFNNNARLPFSARALSSCQVIQRV